MSKYEQKYKASEVYLNKEDIFAMLFLDVFAIFRKIKQLIGLFDMKALKSNKERTRKYLEKRGEGELCKDLLYEQSLNFLDAKDDKGNSPIHLAVYRNQAKLLQAYIQAIRKIMASKHPKEQEEMRQYTDKIQFCISYYLNLPNSQGLTPIHIAAGEGNLYIISYLEKFGARNFATTNEGLNVLHFASQKNQSLAAYYFMNKIEVTSRDNEGYSPLHWACEFSSYSVVEILSENRLILDMPNNQGETALHLAVRKNNMKIVRMLIKAGAKKNLRNAQNKLPSDLALQLGFLSIYEILEQSKNWCPKSLYANSFSKRNLISLFFFPVLFEILMFLNLWFVRLDYAYLQSARAVIFIISLFFFGLFFYLTGLLETSTSPETVILEEIDPKNYCFHCHLKKSQNQIHCYICKKCTPNFYKHAWIFDNCLSSDDIRVYILFYCMLVFLISICIPIQIKIYTLLRSNYYDNNIIILLFSNLILIFPAAFAIYEIYSACVFRRQRKKKFFENRGEDSFEDTAYFSIMAKKRLIKEDQINKQHSRSANSSL